MKLSITRYHLIQCLLAAIVITLIILVGETFSNNVVNAAIGSSVALVFLYPSNPQNKFRSLVLGNVVAILSFIVLNFLFSLFNQDLAITIFNKDFHFFVGVTFFLCIFIMSITNTEHIPAAGTSIGLSIHTLDYALIIFIFFSVTILYVIKVVIDKYGINLF